MKSELGNIQIFFGQVVDIDDPCQSLRCRVAIQGKTDQIEKEKLPWYYSFGGINSLPAVGDEIAVLIFDNNFATGFYNKSLINGSVQTVANYKDYVEVFKKMTGDTDAAITYSMSQGLELHNDKSKINAGLTNLSLSCGDNNISISEQGITLGSEGLEPALMGNKTVQILEEIIDYVGKVTHMIYGGFQDIMMTATPSPFTAAIGAKLSTFITSEIQIRTLGLMLKTKLMQIQSKKTYHS